MNFKLEVIPAIENGLDAKEFNFETNEAVFELFLSDKSEQVFLKYLENN